MLDYFKNYEYYLKHIWFYYDDSRYSGTGFLSWDRSTGFHVLARVNREKPHPTHRHIKSISFESRPKLHMRLENGLSAIAPLVDLDDLSLSFNGGISLDIPRVIFSQPIDRSISKKSWYGTALYETRSNLLLPDSVNTQIRIDNWKLSDGFTRTGILYENEVGQRVVAQLQDKKFLSVNWLLPEAEWTKRQSWLFGEAFQNAISFAAGEVIQLRQHKAYRNRRIYIDMRAKYKTLRLGVVHRMFDRDILDKSMIIDLANFLASSDSKVDICRRIFEQLADASEQRTQQASELLVATILEAALRSLYNRPFELDRNKRSDPFSLESCLKKFRETYFSDDVEVGRKWKKATNEVIEAHRRLRDRNAHPDWLTTQNGTYSTSSMEQATNDMILLSRFYGYMILAISGFKNLTPVFPNPISDWSPIFTITHSGDETE